MQFLTGSERWRSMYPNASVGLLVMLDVGNPAAHAELQAHKVMLEAALREQFAGYDRATLKKHSPLREYHAYYKRFKNSYHVLLQLESLLFKGKSIPNVAALVEVMFMGELKSQLLTAVHDLDKVQLPIRVEVATGEERYIRMNGREQQLKRDDMFIADGEGVLSSIIYGADQRSSISSETQNVLFTTYAPNGIKESAVRQHLLDMRDYALLIAPEAKVDILEVFR